MISGIFYSLRRWLLGWLHGGPHYRIGSPADPYLLRWYILPRNPVFNVYLHKFLRDDDDRALHDHPWPSLSIVLRGRYVEQTFNCYRDPQTGARGTGRRLHGPGSVIARAADYAHRIELVDRQPCWTLFVTGSTVREWGFHCPKGWVLWHDFVDKNDSGNIGRGCGEMA